MGNNNSSKITFNGSFSNEYDAIAHKIVPAYQAIYDLTHHLLRENLVEDARLLVAGAGTGKEIIDYSQSNPNWSITGFDPAEKMLTIAKNKVIAAALSNNISLVHGLIDDVVERDFDGATSILVMHFLPDDGTKQNFLKKIAEKLKSGALLVLVDLEGKSGSDEFKAFNAAWKNQQLFMREESAKIAEEFEMRENEVHFIPQARIESLLTEAGFVKTSKFFKAYLFGGYVAIKK